MKQDNNLQSDDSETMDSDEINKDSAITDSHNMPMEGETELQTRRSFFKQVAKRVLPVIGGLLMSQLPFRTLASSQSCSGCWYGCSGGCSSCTGSCSMGCRNSCTSCTGSCSLGCKTSCTSCTGSCSL